VCPPGVPGVPGRPPVPVPAMVVTKIMCAPRSVDTTPRLEVFTTVTWPSLLPTATVDASGAMAMALMGSRVTQP